MHIIQKIRIVIRFTTQGLLSSQHLSCSTPLSFFSTSVITKLMEVLLNEIKRICATQPTDNWVPFSEIRTAYPAEMHVEALMIEIISLLKRGLIDVLIEGQNLFLRPL